MNYLKNFWERTNELKKEKKFKDPEFIKQQISKLDNYCFNKLEKIIKACRNKKCKFDDLISSLFDIVDAAYDNHQKIIREHKFDIYQNIIGGDSLLQFKLNIDDIVRGNNIDHKTYKYLFKILYECNNNGFGKIYNYLNDFINLNQLFYINSPSNKSSQEIYNNIYDDYVNNGSKINFHEIFHNSNSHLDNILNDSYKSKMNTSNDDNHDIKVNLGNNNKGITVNAGNSNKINIFSKNMSIGIFVGIFAIIGIYNVSNKYGIIESISIPFKWILDKIKK